MMLRHLEESYKGLERAKDAVEAAEHDLKGDYVMAAVNRAYYAMFYCANSLLHLKNINVKTHSGVRNKFSEAFIKTNILPSEWAQKFGDAYNLRAEADYDLDATISATEARKVIDDAREIVKATEQYLQNM